MIAGNTTRIMDVIMFTCALIIIFFLPAAFLPVALDAGFSSHELNEMGVWHESGG
jgi:hypothetical protein